MTTSAENVKDMRYILRAIGAVLTSDSDLTTLLKYSSTNLNILANTPDQNAKYPSVIFWDESTVNVVPEIDEFKESMINIAVMVRRGQYITFKGETIRDKIYCDVITGRVQRLFQPGNQEDTDLSDTFVQTHSVMVQTRLNTRMEDEIDVWRSDVVITVSWYLKS